MLNAMRDFREFMSGHSATKRVEGGGEGLMAEYESDRPVHELLGEYLESRDPKKAQ